MTDLEKNESVGGPEGQLPFGADSSRNYPYPYTNTLRASGVPQSFYQGGLPLRKFGNPAPLGLFSYASTTFILSLVNVNARGVTTPNAVVGMAFAVGGLCQLLAGMWDFAAGNTFSATSSSSFGGFWISYAIIYTPGSGILSAYESRTELNHAIGFYLSSWFIFTFLMLIASLRSNVATISLYFCSTMTFMFLMIGHFVSNTNTIKAGGVFGIVTSLFAYYCACANLYSKEASFFTLPVVSVPGSNRST